MAAGCPVVAASSGGILILWLTGERILFDPEENIGAIAATQRL